MRELFWGKAGDEMGLRQNWWALVLRGLAGIVFGLAAFFLPGITLVALMLMFGIFAVVDGVFNVAGAVTAAHGTDRRWALFFEGIVGILVGLMAVFLPGKTVLALVYLIAAWAIITGILEIAAAIRLRREIHGEWMMALSGVFSVVLGILVIALPRAGILAFIWYIGAYALITGVLLLMLGFRLRGGGTVAHRRAAA